MARDGLSRREILAGTAVGAIATVTGAQAGSSASKTSSFQFEVTRTDEEWRAMLSEEEYRILREGGTEKPKSSPLWIEEAEGTYHCKGCDLPVYTSEWKEVLDKGWVFFYHSIAHSTMTSIDGPESRYEDGQDLAIASAIETHCRRCGSHLGHILIVSGDGRQLHCINGHSLDFKAETA